MHRFQNRSLFALLFSDLMMGAMAVMMVMLIFLGIVDIRGTGVAGEDAVIQLPPGLLDRSALPRTSIRIVACPSEDAKVLKVIPTNSSDMQLAFGEVGDCLLQIASFPDGLKGASVDVKANSDAYLREMYVTAAIGGWHSRTVAVPPGTKLKDQTLIRLSLSSREVLFLP